MTEAVVVVVLCLFRYSPDYAILGVYKQSKELAAIFSEDIVL